MDDNGEERPPLPPHLDPRGPRPTSHAATAPRPRRSRKRIAAWTAGGLAAVLVLGGITGLVSLHEIVNRIKKLDVFGGLTDRPGGGVKGDLNILLVGSDSREGLTAQQQHRLHVGHDAGRRSD